MSVEEFALWQAFYLIQPFGQDWEEQRIAFQTVNLLQMHTRTKLKTDDYLAFKRPRRKQTVEEQASIVLSVIEGMKRGE